MIVNYLLQIRAFDDYRMYETKLSSGQVSLWYTLMSINNKAHWQKWFTAANVVLERLSGLSRSGIVKNRNVLKQLGLIDFQSNGRKATSYQVCVLYTSDGTQRSTQSSTQDSAQRSTQDSAQNSSTLVKHKQNKTEKKKEKSSSDDSSIKDNFEKLWKLYPKKAGKKPAFNAYKRAIKKGVTNKQIQTGIVELIKHQKDKKYYPNGSTWFNQARWEDDYSDSSPEPPVLNKPVPRWMRIHQVVEACGHDKAQALVELRKEYADMTAEEIDRILNPEKYEEAENF
ncbi:DNA replication protein DnaD [Lentilactobacillus diolivorans]|uniref:DNA replication protein DnaD n=1 Tax=Lentilactobacillus diolivorans TaxID=179838 RepID=UPI002468AC5C|nr:DNA replication protein DnaD [Lentilactobacillus diolivorans]MDH5106494.1 DNA replication protein DnaD [Lentilactobacillus diolivorans]